MEVNIDPEVAKTLKIQYAKDYGYTLQRHEVLWSHLLGRIRTEIDMNLHYTLPLNRFGSDLEAGRSPGARLGRVEQAPIVGAWSCWFNPVDSD